MTFCNISNNGHEKSNGNHSFQNIFLQYCNTQTRANSSFIGASNAAKSDCNESSGSLIFDLDEFDAILEKTANMNKNNNNNILPKCNEQIQITGNDTEDFNDIIGIINKDTESGYDVNEKIENSTQDALNTETNNDAIKNYDTQDKKCTQNINVIENNINKTFEKETIQKYVINTENLSIDVVSISSDDELVISGMTNNDFNLDVISISSTDSVFVKNNIKHTNSVPNFDSNIAKSSVDDVANFNIETENQNTNAVNTKHDLDDKSDNCSYHSSDFEFITEEEANIEGLIINFRPKTVNNVKQPEKVNLNASSHFSRFYLPGTSQYDDNFNYRENHAIPEGDDYLNLFQGIFAPALTPLHLLENKSFRSTRMNVQFEGIGFDMKVLNKKNMEDQKDVAFKEEAKECARKILETYPEDNKKRRRRF